MNSAAKGDNHISKRLKAALAALVLSVSPLSLASPALAESISFRPEDNTNAWLSLIHI